MQESSYLILGLGENATLQEVENAYKTLKEKYHIDGISAGQDILGVEGEFNDALAQLGVSAKIMEDNPEQDSLAAPLDVFGKNFEN